MRNTNNEVIYLTLSPELKARVRAVASVEERSMSAQLRYWIERALEDTVTIPNKGLDKPEKTRRIQDDEQPCKNGHSEQ